MKEILYSFEPRDNITTLILARAISFMFYCLRETDPLKVIAAYEELGPGPQEQFVVIEREE